MLCPGQLRGCTARQLTTIAYLKNWASLRNVNQDCCRWSSFASSTASRMSLAMRLIRKVSNADCLEGLRFKWSFWALRTKWLLTRS